jgi:hypothetical protein
MSQLLLSPDSSSIFEFWLSLTTTTRRPVSFHRTCYYLWNSRGTNLWPLPLFLCRNPNQIWNISVKDYPARIVDLREYRRPISQKLSLESQLSSSFHLKSSPAELQSQASTSDTGVIAGFESWAPAPTILYVCRESRSIAQKSYTQSLWKCRRACGNMDWLRERHTVSLFWFSPYSTGGQTQICTTTLSYVST